MNNNLRGRTMKKIIFIILSIFTISNIGYSREYENTGIIYDNRMFGGSMICQLIGQYYLYYSVLITEKQVLGKVDKLKIDKLEKSTTGLDTIVRFLDWNKYIDISDNINSFYRAKCRKIRKDDIKIINNGQAQRTIVDGFYSFMENVGMLER